MNAITAVKNTVAPIPAYLFCSPSEHVFKIVESAPEQRMKKFCNMMIDLIDELPKGYVTVTELYSELV